MFHMKYWLLLKKMATALLTAVLISFLCFAVIYHAPGNSAELMLRNKDAIGGLDKRTVEIYSEKLGIIDSFFVQYGRWFRDMLHGDMGTSFNTGLPVAKEFADRFGCTFTIMLLSCAIALLLGIGLGILSAQYHNHFLDHIMRAVAVFNMSVPSFWLALIFLWIFSVKMKLLPSFGYHGILSLLIPSLVLGLSFSGGLMRVTRASVLDSFSSGYVITARGKGLGNFVILYRHILKNILLPVLAMLGSNIAGLISGSIIIENIFGLPGLGNYLVKSISLKDFPVVLGFVFCFGLMTIMINLLIDYSYILIDPRVRQTINEKRKK